jgi:hypothetical protein
MILLPLEVEDPIDKRNQFVTTMSAKRRRQRARRNKQVRKRTKPDRPPTVHAASGAESRSRLGRVFALTLLIRLKLQNKLGVWGSIASLVGVPLSILLFLLPFFLSQLAPRLHVTLDDVFDNLKAHDASFERDPRVARTFWLLCEPGASIALGKCPGPECFQFTLGQLRTEGESLTQEIFLSGEGFGIRAYPGPGLRFEMKYQITIKGSSLAYNPEEGKAWVPLTLARGNFFEMSTPIADIPLKVLDTRSDSLRIHLEVRHGSYVPLRLQGKQPAAK